MAGVSTVLLVGVQTNAVVVGTAFAAINHALRPIIVTDACAGGTQELHDAALRVTEIVASRVESAGIIRS